MFMCELIFTGLIIGFINVAPDVYIIQAQDLDGNYVECEMVLTLKENGINF